MAAARKPRKPAAAKPRSKAEIAREMRVDAAEARGERIVTAGAYRDTYANFVTAQTAIYLEFLRNMVAPGLEDEDNREPLKAALQAIVAEL